MAGEKKQPHRGRERREREPQPMWHDILSEEVKQALKDKGIRTSTGTIDISCGKSRIKLGTRGYASLADEDGILAEGSFECDADGHATFEWKRAIQFTDVWNTFLNLASIVNEISLSDGKFFHSFKLNTVLIISFLWFEIEIEIMYHKSCTVIFIFLINIETSSLLF